MKKKRFSVEQITAVGLVPIDALEQRVRRLRLVQPDNRANQSERVGSRKSRRDSCQLAEAEREAV